MSNLYFKKLNRNISLYYAVEFLSFLNFFIPIWVAYERQFLTFTQMSLIAGFRFFITTVLEIPTGALGDMLGRKWSVAIGFFAEVIGLVVVAIATSGTYIFVGAIFRGSADAFRSGSDTALVYDSLKELKKENLFARIKSKVALSRQFAIITASILAGYLFTINESLPYLAYAFFLGLSGILYFFMQEPKIDTEKFNISRYLEQTKIGIRETFKNAYVKRLSIFYALVGGITLTWQMYFNQIYASEIGYNEIGKSWLFAIIRIINVFIIIRLLHLEKFITKKNVFLFFPIIMISSMVPALVAGQIIGTLLLLAATFTASASSIILDQYTNEGFESKYRATAISALNLYVSVIYMIFVTLSGPVIDSFSMGAFYFIMGIVTLVVILPQGIYLSKNHR